MNVSELRKYVTHFSEELKFKTGHRDEVLVGGQIKNIVPPILEEFPMYLIIVDDMVGTLHIYASEKLYKAYSEHLQIGKHVFVKGFVNVVSHYKYDHLEKDYTVIAYDLANINCNEECQV